MRLLICAILLASSATVARAEGTVTAEMAGAKGWRDVADGAMALGQAEIVVPGAASDLTRYEVVLNGDNPFDAIARFAGPKALATLFLYQPLMAEPDLLWQAAVSAMRRRRGESEERAGPLPLTNGEAAVLVQPGRFSDGTPSQELLAMAFLPSGWIAKLRVSADPSDRDARARAAALLSALVLPKGARLMAPSLAALPTCPRKMPGGKVRPVVSGGPSRDEAMATAMLLSLTPAPIVSVPPRRCLVPTEAPGPIPFITAANLDGPPDYCMIVGDAGMRIDVIRDPAAADATRASLFLVARNTSQVAVLRAIEVDGEPDPDGVVLGLSLLMGGQGAPLAEAARR